MYNSDQKEHLAYLARLPDVLKCACKWEMKYDCYPCNRVLMEAAGVVIEGDKYHRPGWNEPYWTSYSMAIHYLRSFTDEGIEFGKALKEYYKQRREKREQNLS